MQRSIQIIRNFFGFFVNAVFGLTDAELAMREVIPIDIATEGVPVTLFFLFADTRLLIFFLFFVFLQAPNSDKYKAELDPQVTVRAVHSPHLLSDVLAPAACHCCWPGHVATRLARAAAREWSRVYLCIQNAEIQLQVVWVGD